MFVKVRAFAQFRQIIGAEQTVEVAPGTGAIGLFRQLAEGSGTIRGILFEESGAMKPHVIVMVNGKRVPAGADLPLGEGDEVAVFPPVAGG